VPQSSSAVAKKPIRDRHSAYGDDPSCAQLHPEGDDLNDDHLVDGAADDVTNDRTHNIQLGGEFRVTEVTPSVSTGAIAVDVRATVPVRSTYTCNNRVLPVFVWVRAEKRLGGDGL
jgi:hypothetical protein